MELTARLGEGTMDCRGISNIYDLKLKTHADWRKASTLLWEATLLPSRLEQMVFLFICILRGIYRLSTAYCTALSCPKFEISDE